MAARRFMEGSFDDGSLGYCGRTTLMRQVKGADYRNRSLAMELEFKHILLRDWCLLRRNNRRHEKGDPKIAFEGQAERIGCLL
ncbi:MAG: hypothetical protein C4K60_13850 [Ideonella sp. MAG2]|nr:MAG: hypothetical protein C4K60_13850 [Ideonella sp. MAG2]